MNTNHQNDVLLREFREKLEAVLDEHFPKIEEEGEAKRLNKRGQALMIYSEAVTLARTAFDKVRAGTIMQVKRNLRNVAWPSKEDDGIEHMDCSYEGLFRLVDEALSPPSGGTK